MDNLPSNEARNWAIAAHLCALAWLAGGWLQALLLPLIIWRDQGPDMAFCLRLVKRGR